MKGADAASELLLSAFVIMAWATVWPGCFISFALDLVILSTVDSWGESREIPPTYSFDKTRVTVGVNQLFLCLATESGCSK